MMQGCDTRLEPLARELAARAGLGGPVRLDPLPGGRNNRVFALRAPGGDAFLKAYFRHPDDPRDRLASEFAFLEHAWSLGLRCIPRPLANDRDNGLGLLSLLEGSALTPADVAPAHVRMAARFYRQLNPEGSRPQLPEASEACFSLADHRQCVARRVERLVRAAQPQNSMRTDAAAFIRQELAPAWETLEGKMRHDAARDGLDLEQALEPDQRRVSPSDFGFHNALLGPGGELAFFDFEYAGLDDPAKMVCDFFCQPDLPAPETELPAFLEQACEASPGDRELPARVALLLPLYRLKWCCIMLNDFLPVSAARRDYAEGGEAESRRDRQLARTKTALQTLR